MLRAGKIGTVEFEYHTKGMWQQLSLNQTLAWLAGFSLLHRFPRRFRLLASWQTSVSLFLRVQPTAKPSHSYVMHSSTPLSAV